jgi:agmatinase
MSSAPEVVVVGVPLDENSSFLRGAAAAPEAIRHALHCGSANLCSEDGIDLEDHADWEDRGDLDPGAGAEALDRVEVAAATLLGEERRVVALGGDHSISWPLVRAHAARHRNLTILHLDAHADLYDEFGGSRRSHACPFARIMEEGLARRLVQIGVRTLNAHQRRQAERFGVEIHGASAIPALSSLELEPPLYLSLDLDVLDPAFAPGVSHHEPGGLSTREAIDLLREVPFAPVGADLVELNPARDPSGISAMAAAKLLKEILAAMLR